MPSEMTKVLELVAGWSLLASLATRFAVLVRLESLRVPLAAPLGRAVAARSPRAAGSVWRHLWQRRRPGPPPTPLGTSLVAAAQALAAQPRGPPSRTIRIASVRPRFPPPDPTPRYRKVSQGIAAGHVPLSVDMAHVPRHEPLSRDMGHCPEIYAISVDNGPLSRDIRRYPVIWPVVPLYGPLPAYMSRCPLIWRNSGGLGGLEAADVADCRTRRIASRCDLVRADSAMTSLARCAGAGQPRNRAGDAARMGTDGIEEPGSGIYGWQGWGAGDFVLLPTRRSIQLSTAS